MLIRLYKGGDSMKLTIQSQNEWWNQIGEEIAKQREENPTVIHQWWDGLEWQSYELPANQNYYLCTTQDIQQMVCELDYAVSWISDKIGLEIPYKFINHYVDVIQQGLDNEWQNIVTLIGG
jgi:hypothetical protein